MLIFQYEAGAQTENTGSYGKPGVSFTISNTYSSRLHYYGRTDSLKSTALIPSVSLQIGPGFFINSSFIFINNPQQSFSYTAVIAGAGYKFGGSKGLAGSVYADKFFFANNKLVQSSQKGQTGLSLSYLNQIIDLSAGGSAVFGDNTDYFTSAGLDHRFMIPAGNSVFAVIPTISLNAGTQNFTHSYFVKRNVLILPGTEQEVTTTSKHFKLLSYDISAPVLWVYKRLSVILTPGYVIPQNVIKVAGRPDLSETASNLFYANLGVSFTLGKK